MRFVRDVLQPGDLFIDAGANVGVYTLLATLTPNVNVLAFEPGSEARERLVEHVALNQVEERVEISEFALSDANGQVSFTVGSDVLDHVAEPSADTETVAARRLDDVLLPGLDRDVVLKVDAEGHDLQVLRGGESLLRRVRPPLIVEWSDRAMRDLLEPLGYSVYSYDPETRSLAATEWLRSGTSNILAIADVAAVEARLRRNPA